MENESIKVGHFTTKMGKTNSSINLFREMEDVILIKEGTFIIIQPEETSANLEQSF